MVYTLDDFSSLQFFFLNLNAGGYRGGGREAWPPNNEISSFEVMYVRYIESAPGVH